ncbi:MAG: 30S ribosomal protein S9 [Candidatus Aenigmarchaeota archaeon]|nr:30S ribosomal protein S9 [Candidatus Aenigmarchaeota archaeon]
MKVIIAAGKRKKAVAIASVKEGKGRIRINSKPIDSVGNRYIRMRMKEPLTLAKDYAERVDIDVTVKGGGVWGQADAVRTAIANAVLKWSKDKNLKHLYNDYDKSILISDARQTEPHKPSRSTAGPRRTKQQSKR